MPAQTRLQVLYDVTTVSPGSKGGINTYMLNLLRELRKDDSVDVHLVIKPSRISRRKKIAKALGAPVRVIWPWIGLGRANTIYHGPDFRSFAPRWIPQVVTIHDLAVLERRYNDQRFVEKGILSVQKIMRAPVRAFISVSNFTRDQIHQHFPDLKTPVTPIHLGCDHLSQRRESRASQGGHLLFVGSLEFRKNVISIVEAFEVLCERGRTEDLVLVGHTGFGGAEIMAKIQSSPVRSRIHLKGSISNDELSSLFAEASVFLFPSWYEGFGIPVIEAMSFGVPVVTSNSGAVSEVAGDAALKVDPADTQALADAAEQILIDPELSLDLTRRGYERAQSLSWAKCARETLQVYRSLIGP